MAEARDDAKGAMATDRFLSALDRFESRPLDRGGTKSAHRVMAFERAIHRVFLAARARAQPRVRARRAPGARPHRATRGERASWMTIE